MLRRTTAISAWLLITGLVLAFSTSPASADPIESATTGAYGVKIDVGGSNVIPPTPSVSSSLADADDTQTLIDIPASPVAVSGTLTAAGAAHNDSDLPSQLTVVSQGLAGPYNAAGFAQVEGLEVLLDTAGPGVSLLSAGVLRSEVVASCSAGQTTYSANTEIVDLRIGGEQLPLNGPLSDILDAIDDVVHQAGLNIVVDVHRNRLTELPGGGAAADALVVQVLDPAGPLVDIVIGHSEVSGAACAADTPPECRDGIDNDGDGFIDFAGGDPGCDDPDDDDETDTELPRSLPEPEIPRSLPRTGPTDAPLTAIGIVLGGLGLGTAMLRRRAVV